MWEKIKETNWMFLIGWTIIFYITYEIWSFLFSIFK